MMSVLIVLKDVQNVMDPLLTVSPVNKDTYCKELNVSNVGKDALIV